MIQIGDYIYKKAQEDEPTYLINELEDEGFPSARDRARDSVREGMFHLTDMLREDLERLLKDKGFESGDVDMKEVYWSVGGSGDFVAFAASLPDSLVLQYLPNEVQDLVLQRDVEVRAWTRIRHHGGGRMSMYGDAEADAGYNLSDEDEDEVQDILDKYEEDIESAVDELVQDLEGDLVSKLNKNYEWYMADEQIDDDAMENEWRFYEDGSPA